MNMKALVGLVVLLLTTRAFAQTAPPKQAKAQAAAGCKFVGTVKGTKLWAGDCLAPPELRGTSPTAEPAAPAPTPEANPPAAKQ